MANAFDQFDASPTPPSPKAPAGNAFDAFDTPAAAPIRIKNAAQLQALRLDHPEQKGMSDADFLDWFGKSRTVPTTAILEGAPTPEPPKDTSASTGFAGGFLKPVDNLATWISHTRAGKAVDEFGQKLGLPSADAAVAHNDAMRANNTRTGYQLLGNIAATIPLSRLPGGVIAQGGASGALLSDAKDARGVAMDAIKGAAGSAIVKGGFNTLGALATGVKDAGARALNKAGVNLTIGQLGRAAGNLPGRIAAGIEDRLAGYPIVGDIVNAARDRSTLDYNKSVLGRALDVVGEKIPAAVKHGHEMIAYVGDKLSEKYQALLPKLAARPDAAFETNMNAAIAATHTLPDAMQGQFQRIINDALPNRAAVGGGALKGTALKDAESKLTKLAGQYRKSTDVDQQRLGEAIDLARASLRDLVERQNPAHAGELQALNKAWAQLTTAETAAARPGNTTGLFTPKGYAAAARLADNSVRKRATARGAFPNQALTDAAADILPNAVPDSGTAGRASLALLGAGGAGGLAAIASHPVLAAGAGAATIPFTRVGQSAMNKLAFANRPLALRGTAIPLSQLAKYAPALAAPLAVSPKQ